MDCTAFMQTLIDRNPGETEFHRSVHEVVESVAPWINEHREYDEARVLERLVEPDRVVSFRVAWEDDHSAVRVKRGYHVQFSNGIGPYRAGLRFDSSVSSSVLKFLAFEQTLRHSLTGLPLGSSMGGSDFEPRGRSDREVMRFSQSFMSELRRYMAAEAEVPTGDVGVGDRELGFLSGQYQRLASESGGVLAGEAPDVGGASIHAEATGFGVVYFAAQVLASRGLDLEGLDCVISGSGKVALHAAQKLVELGARVRTLSERAGFVHAPEGLGWEQIEAIVDLKARRSGGLDAAAREFGFEYVEGDLPWRVPCDLAFPCATHYEIDARQAQRLVDNGCRLVCEGANMPCSPEATVIFQEAGVAVAPSKAASAGGAAMSALEWSERQPLHRAYSPEEIDGHLEGVMARIHADCVEYGAGCAGTDYVKGANLAAFVRVAKAMLARGIM